MAADHLPFGHSGPLAVATARATTAGYRLRGVILVEGDSDRAAVEALAHRRGRDLHAQGIFVVPIGGAQAIRNFLDVFGPAGLDVQLAGLCDQAEAPHFRRGLERAGLGRHLDQAAMESLGFGVCIADLEDELIRSLGTDQVERIIAAHGELTSFRTFQKQPAQRARAAAAQLRRFMGTRSGRKISYGRALVDGLDLANVPHPLDVVLAHF